MKKAPEVETMGTRSLRLFVVMACAFLWSGAAVTLAHQGSTGVTAWVLGLGLGFLGDPVAIIAGRKLLVAQNRSSWGSVPLAVFGGVSIPIAVFVGLEAWIPTGGIIATAGLVLLSLVMVVLEPKRPFFERLLGSGTGLF